MTAVEAPFEPDAFQLEAFAAIDAGKNVVVAAPTGAGKTLVAEYGVRSALERGGRAFYTTPIKALSNQKFHDLQADWGPERVGLLTGDNTINPDADVVVMTTEVLRNMIYSASSRLERLQVVVLDEVHYLQDPVRGPVWEEVIVHLPAAPRMVCLSATVSNVEEFTDWIATLRGDTVAVVEHKRPVPLEHRFIVAHPTGDLEVLPLLRDGRPNPQGRKFSAGGGRTPKRGSRTRGSRLRVPKKVDVLDLLHDEDRLPAIWFMFSRAGCNDAARTVRRAGFVATNRGERAEIHAIVDRHIARLGPEVHQVLGLAEWRGLVGAGVAAHHAGMIPAMKEAVEECFLAGLIRVVFATETLALGINMPARTVVVDALSKYAGQGSGRGGHAPLTPGQFTQMTGRAGRRGLDRVGFAYVPWSPHSSFDDAADLALIADYPLKSAFRPTYNMVVNLVGRYRRDQALSVLHRSFAQFQTDRSMVEQAQRLEVLRRRSAEQFEVARCDRVDTEAAVRRLSRRTEADNRPVDFSGLAPGSIIADPERPGWLLVIGRRDRIGSEVWVRAVNRSGRVIAVSSKDFAAEPAAMGHARLPHPIRPKDPAWRAAAVALLQETTRGLTRVDANEDSDGPPVGSRGVRAAFDGCPDAARHLAAWNRHRRTESEIAKMGRKMANQSTSLEARFTSILSVLRQRGYVDGWSLTDRGSRLSGVYSDMDLLVSQALETGLFDGLSPPEMAAMASFFTYRHRSPEAPTEPHFPRRVLRQRWLRLVQFHDRLVEVESNAKLPLTPSPEPYFAEICYRWTEGAGLGEVLTPDTGGGDFVRNIRQVIDLLDQIDVVTDRPGVASAARTAVLRLRRDVVVSDEDPRSSAESEVTDDDPTL